MSVSIRILLVSVLIFMSQACATFHGEKVPLNLSAEYYDYIQPSFERYVDVSRQWLAVNRDYISDDHIQELDMNAPFMLLPNEFSNKAVLMVHGLGDSPYYFSDIARSLQSEGFFVYVLLLPGHGSKPADLMLPEYEDWQSIVDHYAAMLKKNHKEVWLAGFSTGANLVTINAIEQGDVSGLLLFSPGFETHTPLLEKLASVADLFMDWGWETTENNLARYQSSPINASIAYTDSATYLRDLFDDHEVTIPTFIVVSEADSIINAEAIREYFDDKFINDHSRLIWYGNASIEQHRHIVRTMNLPELQISTGSHMSPLFSPTNAYYGQFGDKLMCENSLSSSETERCYQGENVWFSAWGYEEADKLYARLTWNPHYDEMAQQMSNFVSASLVY